MTPPIKYFLLALLGLLVGFYFGGQDQGASQGLPGPPEPVVITDHVAINELQKKVERQQARMQEDEARIAELSEQIAALEQAPVVEEVPEKPSVENPFVEMTRKVATQMSASRYDSEMTKLITTLKLKPDQVAALEDFYSRKGELEARMTQLVLEGKNMDDLTKEATAAQTKEPYHTVDQLLAELLTPEQAADYKAYKKGEKAEKKEAAVLAALSGIQREVSMTGEQKDRVYAVLYEQKYKLSAKERKALSSEGDPMAMAVTLKLAEDERLLESLSSILDADQLELYKIKQEQEMQMLEATAQMMHKMQGKSESE